MPQEQKKIRSADAEVDAILSRVAIGGKEPPLTQEERDLQLARGNVFQRLEPTIGNTLLRIAEDVVGQGGGAFIGGTLGAGAGPHGVLAGSALGAAGGEALLQGLRGLAGRPDAPQTQGEAFRDIGLAAAGGPLQEAGAAFKLTQAGRAATLLKGSERITPMLAAAEEAGVGITKGQARGGATQGFESFLSRTFGGTGTFKRFGQQQAKELNVAVDDFLSTISRSKLTSEQAGEVMQTAIKSARKTAGENVGAALDSIVKELPGLKVAQQGTLAEKAGELLRELRGPTAQHPALRKIAGEDINQAIAVLEDFTAPETKLSVEDAVKLRGLLFKLTDSPGISSIGMSTLKRLNGALHDSIGEAVKGAGREDLFKAFEEASSGFRSAVETIETSFIQRAIKSSEPELIVGMLLKGGSASRIEDTLKLMGEKNFKPVARATIQKVFDDASVEEILISQSFANMRKKVGDAALGKLMGEPEQIARFERLSKLIDGLGLTRSLTEPKTAISGVGLMQGVIGGLGTGAGIVTDRLPEAAGFLTLMLGVPRVLSEAATSPRLLASIEKELAIAARQEGRIGVVKRLAGFVTAQIGQDVSRSFLRPQQPNE